MPPKMTIFVTFLHHPVMFYSFCKKISTCCPWLPKNVYFLNFWRAKSRSIRFLIPENGIDLGIMRYYVEKLGKIAIFYDLGSKNTLFCHFRGFLGVKKFFRRRIRVFQLFLPLEMTFLEKNFRKIDPKKFQNSTFFGTPCTFFPITFFPLLFSSYFFPLRSNTQISWNQATLFTYIYVVYWNERGKK